MSKRAGAVRLVLYNHKGGVGKTTLTVNIAYALARAGKRVLLVDTDPQCNLTSYLVEVDVVNKWLDDSDTAKGVTIWSAIREIAHSTGGMQLVKPVERSAGIFLVPGDIRLSEFEQDLNQVWLECLQRKMRGYRAVSAISDLINEIVKSKDIDFVFYDVGPNIGPLNKIVLLDCDYFIVPAACDEFSTRALSTLGHSLSNWIRDWEVITQLAPEDALQMPGRPKFLGYILQKFRVYGGEIASGQARYAAALEKAAQADIVTVLRNIDKSLARTSLSANKLGQVKDFNTLASLAQRQGVDFYNTSQSPLEQRMEARTEFGAIAKKIITRTSDAEADA